MTGGLEGTPVWAVLMTTTEIDGLSASTTVATRVLAIAKSEKAAGNLAYDLVPHTPRDAHLTVQEAVMVDSLPGD